MAPPLMSLHSDNSLLFLDLIFRSLFFLLTVSFLQALTVQTQACLGGLEALNGPQV